MTQLVEAMTLKELCLSMHLKFERIESGDISLKKN